MTISGQSRAIVPVLVFCALLGWSTLAYLSIRVDADILAEAIQVQRWLADPFVVLSYPGQLYGGVLEYPLIAIGEWLFPGQVYGFTALRILYLPLTGLLTVYATHLLLPRLRPWPFVPIVIAGPAVLHSMMAIKDLYPFAWLLAMSGVVITYAIWERRASSAWLLAGGALMGLAIYQHPTTSLVVVPLACAGLVRWSPAARSLWWWVIGVLVGITPLILARFAQGDVYVSYTPERQGFPELLGAFGLNGSTWTTAVVPTGWGLLNTDLNALAFPTGLQLVVNWAVFLFILGCVTILFRDLLGRRWGSSDSDRRVIATVWFAAFAVIVAITVVVPPVFFYGAALAVPVWITMVAGVNGVWGKPGVVVTVATIILAGLTSLGSLLAWNPALPGAIGYKLKQSVQVADTARAIEDAGISMVFGDYWETLPIAYASQGRLNAVTVPVSRFAVPDVTTEAVIVAVPTGYTALPPGLNRWTNAETAVGFVDANCTRLAADVVEEPFPIRAYSCPAEVWRPWIDRASPDRS